MQLHLLHYLGHKGNTVMFSQRFCIISDVAKVGNGRVQAKPILNLIAQSQYTLFLPNAIYKTSVLAREMELKNKTENTNLLYLQSVYNNRCVKKHCHIDHHEDHMFMHAWAKYEMSISWHLILKKFMGMPLEP